MKQPRITTLALTVLLTIAFAVAASTPYVAKASAQTNPPQVTLLDRVANIETALFGGANTSGTATPTFVKLAPAAAQTIVGQALIDVSGFTGPHQESVTQALTGDGAITVKLGVVILSKGTAAAVTIAAPTSGTDDGKLLRVLSTTAAAHVITSSVDGFNAKGSSGTCTFGAAIGNGVLLMAYNGHWYVLNGTGNTVA